jgi:hypothetical protein
LRQHFLCQGVRTQSVDFPDPLVAYDLRKE